MSQRPEEISDIIKEQIKHYQDRIEMVETGTVVLVGDGMSRESLARMTAEPMAGPTIIGSSTAKIMRMP